MKIEVITTDHNDPDILKAKAWAEKVAPTFPVSENMHVQFVFRHPWVRVVIIKADPASDDKHHAR